MATSENNTQPTNTDPRAFIEAVEHPVRRKDGLVLLDLFRRATALEPVMWGPSIIGFGGYAYKYESGREGTSMLTGFSPRKANLVLYIMPGYRDGDMAGLLSRLGKHRASKACLYINKLADVDETVLEEIIIDGLRYMRRHYETWDA
ncbi:MAG: DUF1801 domain-containing protein [Pseudomonadota bacterium]